MASGGLGCCVRIVLRAAGVQAALVARAERAGPEEAGQHRALVGEDEVAGHRPREAASPTNARGRPLDVVDLVACVLRILSGVLGSGVCERRGGLGERVKEDLLVGEDLPELGGSGLGLVKEDLRVGEDLPGLGGSGCQSIHTELCLILCITE